jgi:hypothetical protein
MEHRDGACQVERIACRGENFQIDVLYGVRIDHAVTFAGTADMRA